MMKKYVENGINCFEKHEILEILLFNIFTRCNTNDISHRLLNEFKSVKGVLSAAVNDLTSVEGIGENAAARICFLGDFFRYLALEESGMIVLDSTERVVQFCRDIEEISTKEFFVILFMDKKQTLITKYFVRGHFNFVTLVKRDIAVKAVSPGSVGAVAVHNHIGEFTRPSSADVYDTNRLRLFLNDLGVNLYDHLILHNGSYYSMRTCPSCREIWI